MAINSDIRDQAYQFFVEEAPELLQTIESGLLELRRERDKSTIHSIMRAAHSLKGGSASVGLDAIKQISHRLEAIFKSLYSESLTIDTELETRLLAAYDCLRLPLTEVIETGEFDAEAALTAADGVLAPLEAHCQEAIEETKDFVPSSSDLGINMASSIFEVDVAAGIQRLEDVLANSPQDIAAELRAQAEVFIGFSELLNLPGFARIAQTAVAALDICPDNTQAIATVAIENLQAGRAAVLAGDTVGGEVHPQLRQLAQPAAKPAQAEELNRAAVEDAVAIDVTATDVTATDVTAMDVTAMEAGALDAGAMDAAALDAAALDAIGWNAVDLEADPLGESSDFDAFDQDWDAIAVTEPLRSETEATQEPRPTPNSDAGQTRLNLNDEAYQFFAEEAPDLLETIETGLLTLRQERDKGTIHSIMRAAHSLKGGAASVGLEAIKAIAHRLETIFKALYSDSLIIDTDLETQLLAAFDCLRLPLVEQLNTGYANPQTALASADTVLSPLEARCRDAIRETEDFVPGSADLGTDMTASILEVDVAAGIQQLETSLSHGPDAIAAELREQVGVFIGFAELLNLPRFGEIAQLALTALETHPNRVAEVAEVAIRDLQASRAAILAGDAVGGQPSDRLVELAAAEAPTPDAAGTTAPDDDSDEALQDIDLAVWDAIVTGADPETLDGNAETEPPSEVAAFPSMDAADSDRPLADTWNTPDTSAVETADMELDAEDAAEAGETEDSAPEAIAAVDPSSEIDINGLSHSPAEDADSEISATTSASETDLSDPEPAAPMTSTVEHADDIGDDGNAAQEARPVNVPTQRPSRRRAKTTPKPTAATLTVRVDAERLARMNNLLGEITINRNGLDLQNTQAQNAIGELHRRFERFQTAVEGIRSLSDQLLIMDQHAAAVQRASTPSLSNGIQDNFDSLEMDRYSTLYAQTQLLLEEIVQLEEAVEDVSLFTHQSGQMLGRHRKMLSQMQDEVMWARMLPVGSLLNRFPRVLRDLSNQYGKPVRLTLEGTDLLVDKAVLEKLYDPLLHLLRNGFDHGIESIVERQQQDKPAEGQISITATYRGRQVVIEVRDDGRGLDSDRIRQRAIQLGLLTAAEIEQIPDQDIYELIFQPGFSTAARVSDLSGRGVGLDAVREQVRELNGRINISSKPGEGTTFTLLLPLTLTMLNLLICFAGSTPLAFRSSGITEVIIPKPGQTSRSGDDTFLHWQGRTLRVYQMTDLLSYNCLLPETPPSRVLSAVPSPADWDSPMLILRRGKETIAIQVDRLVTEQELVVKPFGRAISPPSYAYGCTVLGDGSLIPVIDSLVLLDAIFARYQHEADVTTVTAALERAIRAQDQQSAVQMTEAVTLLVIDDAVTSRRTLALSLERAGYRVLQARDGQEGLEQLQQNPDVQLIVCDVEMPNMNGFEFLTHRRQSADIAQIPTVMLTSRSNDKHRWLAKQLGATDYFTKPYLEQEFLNAIHTHIETSSAQLALSKA